jgi:glucuronyl/N-acetylglucosaminyl transferase EXT2
MEEEDTLTTMMKLTSRNRNSPAMSSSPGSMGDGHQVQSTGLATASASLLSSDTLYSVSSSSSFAVDMMGIADDDEDRYQKFTRQHKHYTVLLATWKHLWYRWKLLKSCSKVATTFIAILIVLHVVLGLWDHCFYQIGNIGGISNDSRGSSNISKEKSFAVVINTYKRPDMLKQAIRHYADTCGKRYKVGQVFVVWAEQGVQVPTPESFFDDPTSSKLRTTSTADNARISNRSPVEILRVSKDSLNSRFEPIPQLQTTSVFMVDDDIRVGCSSLLLAFQAWKANPDSMVGYYPRLSSSPLFQSREINSANVHGDQQQLVYHAWPIVHWRRKLNFVLTKASFLHSKYLELYTNDETFPKEIKEHVDRHMNCEDIAMSMLVANYTKYQSSLLLQLSSSENKYSTPPFAAARPIYVEGQVSDLGLFGGISTGSGHMTTRSDCLTQLTAIFRSKGWGSPLDYEYDLGESSWIRHAPGIWWQYKPSNLFEWFAFANTFT